MLLPHLPSLQVGSSPDQTRIKATLSICPRCLEQVPATVFQRQGAVFLRKTCPTHGDEEVVLASDASLYWNADEASGPGCGTGCCSVNHSCTLIFDITEKCNLTCPTCLAGSSPEHSWHLPVEDFTAQFDRLLANGKGDAEVVQLSGGEPTVHPDLERIVQACSAAAPRRSTSTPTA